jgi:hypothetical protein
MSFPQEKLESMQAYETNGTLNLKWPQPQWDDEPKCGYCLEPSEQEICDDCKASLRRLDQ